MLCWLDTQSDLVLGNDVVSSLLEWLAGAQSKFRSTCNVWGTERRKDGQELTVKALKNQFLKELVSLLPPVALSSLFLQHAVMTGFGDYHEAGRER